MGRLKTLVDKLTWEAGQLVGATGAMRHAGDAWEFTDYFGDRYRLTPTRQQDAPFSIEIVAHRGSY